MNKISLAIALVTLGLITASPSNAQVRIAIGFHVNPPRPPQPLCDNEVVEAPTPDAVWIRGYWSWDEYEGEYVWIRGHWAIPQRRVVYREPEYRHVPHGVAHGWWKNHGYSDEDHQYSDRRERHHRDNDDD